MKITFIQPDFPEVQSDDSVFPFGYSSLAALLIKAGHEVDILFPGAYGLTLQDIAKTVKENKAEVFAIGGLFPYLPVVEKLTAMIKKLRADARVVLGGPMVTHTPELVLRKTGADFCIAGEGEIALLELVKCLENNIDYSNIKGIVFRRDNEIVNNGLAELMPLEKIPMPNWEKFPMEYYIYSDWYLPSWSRTRQKRVMSWLASRGCPMKCNFCASGCAPRYKKISQVISELDEINDRFHPSYIMMVDNFLMKDRQYSTEFCKGLIKKNFPFKYSMTGRVNIVDSSLLRLFKESGCEIIFYGLECANNEILKKMHKGITVEETLEAIRKTKEAGISPMVSIMFGQPDETLQDFVNSIKVALMTSDPTMPSPNIASVMPLLTFPGTGIYRHALKNGYIKNEDDYYEQFFGNRLINYTKYSAETIQSAINIGNIMYRWNYHRNMAKNLEGLLKVHLGSLFNKDRKMVWPFIKAFKRFLDYRSRGELTFRKWLAYFPWLKRILKRFLKEKSTYGNII